MNFEKIKTVLRTAIIPAVRFALVFGLMLPFRFGIHWIFDSSTDFDWRLGLKVGATLTVLWYVGAVLYFWFDLRNLEKIDSSSEPSFPASSIVSGIYGLGLILSTVLFIGLYRERDPGWMQGITLLFAAISFCAWPRTIHCDKSAVWQRNTWGYKKMIPYEEIESISVSGTGRTVVLGRRSSIEHTDQHVGCDEFRIIVSERSGKQIYR